MSAAATVLRDDLVYRLVMREVSGEEDFISRALLSLRVLPEEFWRLSIEEQVSSSSLSSGLNALVLETYTTLISEWQSAHTVPRSVASFWLWSKSHSRSFDLVFWTALLELASSAAAPRPRTRELEWRRNNKAILSSLAGQWVVLEGENIIATGDNAAEVVAKARQQGVRVPYVFFVEPTDQDIVRIGL